MAGKKRKKGNIMSLACGRFVSMYALRNGGDAFLERMGVRMAQELGIEMLKRGFLKLDAAPAQEGMLLIMSVKAQKPAAPRKRKATTT